MAIPAGFHDGARERRLDQHVVVVTGAAGGIGRAVAGRFAAAGAVVVGVDADVDALRDAGVPWAETASVDIRQESAMAELAQEICDRHGRVDVIVNNAGICRVAGILDDSVRNWTETLSVNVVGSYVVSKAFARRMCGQAVHADTGCRGKIVNISSPGARVGRPMTAAYGASKAALDHLTMSLAVALAESMISATVIYPGAVRDGMWSRLADQFAEAEGTDRETVVGSLLENMPTGEFQDPRKVADAAVFVAAHRGMSLNGQAVWTEAHTASIR